MRSSRNGIAVPKIDIGFLVARLRGFMAQFVARTLISGLIGNNLMLCLHQPLELSE
jgi:hypothetical protein